LLYQQPLWSERDRKDLSFALTHIGFFWNNKKVHDLAILYLQKSQNIFLKLPKNPKRDIEIASMYRNIADFNIERNNKKKAFQFLTKAQYLLEELPQFPVKVKIIKAQVLKVEGFYHKKLAQEYFNASQCFSKSANILERLPFIFKNQYEIAQMLKEVGFCYKKENCMERAIEYLEKSFNAFASLPHKQPCQTKQIAIVKKNMGFCFEHLQKTQQALSYFQAALKDFQTISRSENNELDIAITLEHIAIAHDHIPGTTGVLLHYRKALKAYKRLPNPHKFQRKINVLETKSYPF